MDELHGTQSFAKRQRPADIEQMRQGTAGVIDPVVAAVIEFDGKDMLEVIALTDFIEKGHEGYPASVTFRASVHST